MKIKVPFMNVTYFYMTILHCDRDTLAFHCGLSESKSITEEEQSQTLKYLRLRSVSVQNGLSSWWFLFSDGAKCYFGCETVTACLLVLFVFCLSFNF